MQIFILILKAIGSIMEITVYVDGRRPRKNGDMPVKIVVRRNNQTLVLNTGLMTAKKFKGTIFPASEKAAKAKTATLTRYYNEICDYAYRNPDVSFDSMREYVTFNIFGLEIKVRQSEMITLADCCIRYAEGMKHSTAVLYRLTADRIREYDKTVRPDTITKSWLNGFEKFLKESKGLSVNGIGQKMRNIRAVLNRCSEWDIKVAYPFSGRDGYRIKEEETSVNNLTAQEFADLRDYPCQDWQKIYVDLFCLTTYLAGINVGDLLLCKGLTNGRLVFTRRKTDKCNATKVSKISLPVYPEAMEIIERYKGTNYLLNIMDNISNYNTFTQHWNKALKKVGEISRCSDKGGRHRGTKYNSLFPNITTYSARYTFASVACNDLDISERTVGLCLGHAWSKEVTSRYISNDQGKIDRAIRKVIDELNSYKGRY